MPNRILRESIRTSRVVGSMTDFQYRMWSYLITYVDDYGRGSADPVLLRAFLFARLDVSEQAVADTLEALAALDAIRLYEAGGEPYLYLPDWDEHQKIRAKRSRFPAPPEDGQAPADADTCAQTPADGSGILSVSLSENRSISEAVSSSENRSISEAVSLSGPAPERPAPQADAGADGELPSVREISELAAERDGWVDAAAFRRWLASRPGADWREELRRLMKPRRAARDGNPALDYSQREHTLKDYEGLYVDLTKL